MDFNLLKKKSFVLFILCIFFSSSVWSTELVLCQAAKVPYQIVFLIPNSPQETTVGKLYYGWETPTKLDTAPVSREIPATLKSFGLRARCWAKYGPDGGMTFTLQEVKSSSLKYRASFTPQGPTGSGKTEELGCE